MLFASTYAAPTPSFSYRRQRRLGPNRSFIQDELRKTEICKFFMMGSCCRDAKACAFAHGPCDLRQDAFEARVQFGSIPRPALYKTKPCFTWDATGSCNYGVRCLFYHNPTSAADIAQLPFADSDSDQSSTASDAKPTRPRRLQIFCNIAP